MAKPNNDAPGMRGYRSRTEKGLLREKLFSANDPGMSIAERKTEFVQQVITPSH